MLAAPMAPASLSLTVNVVQFCGLRPALTQIQSTVLQLNDLRLCRPRECVLVTQRGLDICLQGARWSDAMRESVLLDYPDCSPAITILRFILSTKFKNEKFHSHCSHFRIPRVSSDGYVS